jgi:signal transduction histidine kinase
LLPDPKRRSVDPILDLLIGNSFPELAAAIKAQTERIMSVWEEGVLELMPGEKKLSESELRDHLPQILRLLADVLSEEDPAETERLLSSPKEHGVTRFDQHYNIEQFITEYRVLRRVVVEQAEAALGRPLTTSEGLATDMAIDDMLQRSVVAFVELQEARLRASNDAEKKYLSFLSHDLRNNLNTVILDLEVLKRVLATSPEFAEEAVNLDSTQQSIFDTIGGMDRLLKAEQLRRGVKPKFCRVDLHALASDTSHHFLKRAAKKGVRVICEIEPGAVIESDHEWLTLVLQNLVGNAVKFCSKGTVRVGARFEQRQQEACCVLSVSDEGPGIAPENLNRIFKAFERGETHGQDGVGLGLSIASKAAQLLGGKLMVESEPGVGSTFMLILPVAATEKRN